MAFRGRNRLGFIKSVHPKRKPWSQKYIAGNTKRLAKRVKSKLKLRKNINPDNKRLPQRIKSKLKLRKFNKKGKDL